MSPTASFSTAQDCVVFLDVDGVLHSLYGDEIFNDRCCSLLAKILLETRAAVVLSSTWRKEPSQVDMLNAMLSQRNLPEISDFTEALDTDREEEICEWLGRHPHITKWVAIDDMDLVGRSTDACRRLQGHFVRTAKDKGLRAFDAEKAIAILLQRLEPGDLVAALPGNSLDGLYQAGDEGTVQSCYVKDDGEERINIVWAGAGRTSSVRKADWTESLSYLRPQELQVGDVVEALPGKELIIEGVDYYKPGDKGTVESSTDADIVVQWERTCRASNTAASSWMTFCRLAHKKESDLQIGKRAQIRRLTGAVHLNGLMVTCEDFDDNKGRWKVRLDNGEERLVKPDNLTPEVALDGELQPGDVVQALPSNELDGFYDAGDEGTVQCLKTSDSGDDKYLIVWAKSGKVASVKSRGWTKTLRLVRRQVLEVGDVVEALPGTELSLEDKQYYTAGDQASVRAFSAETDHFRVVWSRTGEASDISRATWMTFCRLVEKQTALSEVAGASPAASKQVTGGFEVGQKARIQGLKSVSAAHRNNSLVSCEKWDASKGRWLVQILTDEAVVSPIEMLVRPENLVAITS